MVLLRWRATASSPQSQLHQRSDISRSSLPALLPSSSLPWKRRALKSKLHLCSLKWNETELTRGRYKNYACAISRAFDQVLVAFQHWAGQYQAPAVPSLMYKHTMKHCSLPGTWTGLTACESIHKMSTTNESLHRVHVCACLSSTVTIRHNTRPILPSKRTFFSLLSLELCDAHDDVPVDFSACPSVLYSVITCKVNRNDTRLNNFATANSNWPTAILFLSAQSQCATLVSVTRAGLDT